MSPAKSEKQRKLFGAALSIKRGESPKTDTSAGKIAEKVSEEQLEDFARKSLIKGIDDFIEKKSILSRIKPGNKPGEKVIVPTHLNKNPFDLKKAMVCLKKY